MFPYITVLTEYKGNRELIKVSDEDDIIYELTASSLLKGCPPTINSAVDKNKCFANKANKIHNNKYDYSSVNYTLNSKKIVINCQKHGNFKLTPAHHLKGVGCKECRLDEYLLKRKNSFIDVANEIHNNKYCYESVVYNGTEEEITIICPKHGEFQQKPHSHISGNGCPKCGRDSVSNYQRKHPTGWNYTNWIKAGEKSKNFDSFKIYIAKCSNNKEEFYKIGRTFTKVKKRLGKTYIPYEHEVIKIIESEDARCICELEVELKRLNKEFEYTPKIKFNGYRECFSKVELDFINKCE